MGASPEWVTAWVAIVAVLISLVIFVAERRQAGNARRIEMTVRMEERFLGAPLVAARATAARSLLEGRTAGVRDVLNFFEMLALLEAKGGTDQELVWACFGDWIEAYRQRASAIIEGDRKEHPSNWAEFVRLSNALSTRFGPQPLAATYISKLLNAEKRLNQREKAAGSRRSAREL